MRPYDVLKRAGEFSGVSMSRVSLALGHPRAYVSSGESRGSVPRVDTYAAMLGVCGYALCAVPVDDVPDSALVIDAEQDTKPEPLS